MTLRRSLSGARWLIDFPGHEENVGRLPFENKASHLILTLALPFAAGVALLVPQDTRHVMSDEHTDFLLGFMLGLLLRRHLVAPTCRESCDHYTQRDADSQASD